MVGVMVRVRVKVRVLVGVMVSVMVPWFLKWLAVDEDARSSMVISCSGVSLSHHLKHLSYGKLKIVYRNLHIDSKS